MDAANREGETIVSQYKALFTRPPENTPSNVSIDGPLLGNGDTLVALGGRTECLRFHVNKNDLWLMKPDRGSKAQPLAVLELSFPDMKGASYHVEQSLQTAVTTGRFEAAGRRLCLEAAVSATENLLWIRLWAEGGNIPARVGLSLPAGADPETAARYQDGAIPVVERRFDRDVMRPAGAACALAAPGGTDAFTLEPGKPVVLALAVCSLFDAADYRAAAAARAAGFDARELPTLRQGHEAWWREFWNESFVEIPDKALEHRYYLSQYVLASASRVYDFPPGLFGWVTTDDPAWGGDYHLNYNHVAPFYGLYAANHIAQADPCHGPILASQDHALRAAREELGVEGLYQPVGLGPLGSIADSATHMQKSNSSYSCVPLAFRWYATYDGAFGRLAWPFVRETATFWENWLTWEAGRYVIYKDAVHEGSGDDVNPIVSLALVRMVMDLAIDMSRSLGLDAARRPRWQHIREHVSDYPCCTVRDLPEPFRPKHLPPDNATLDLSIFRYTERGTPWWGDNTIGIQHIYPAGGIGLDSPADLLARARNQIRVLARWMDFNGMNSFYAAAARVGYDPREILREMAGMLKTLGLPNGMIRGNPHGMEHQSIVPNALQEMLLQSHEGLLRLFPCWPREWDARFGSLRARGAFLVWASLRDGVVAGVRLLSEQGRDCTLVNPWPGQAVSLHRDGKAAETLQGDRITFPTRAGEHVALAGSAGPVKAGVLAMVNAIVAPPKDRT